MLFEIDDRPYKAALDSAKGSEDVAKAMLVEKQAIYDMDIRLKKTQPGAISDEDLIKALGIRDEAKGEVERTSKATVESLPTELRLVQGTVADRRSGRLSVHRR